MLVLRLEGSELRMVTLPACQRLPPALVNAAFIDMPLPHVAILLYHHVVMILSVSLLYSGFHLHTVVGHRWLHVSNCTSAHAALLCVSLSA